MRFEMLLEHHSRAIERRKGMKYFYKKDHSLFMNKNPLTSIYECSVNIAPHSSVKPCKR